MKSYLKPEFRMLGISIEAGYELSTTGNSLPDVGNDWTNNEYE